MTDDQARLTAEEVVALAHEALDIVLVDLLHHGKRSETRIAKSDERPLRRIQDDPSSTE